MDDINSRLDLDSDYSKVIYWLNFRLNSLLGYTIKINYTNWYKEPIILNKIWLKLKRVLTQRSLKILQWWQVFIQLCQLLIQGLDKEE
jgi:hypothetical protein